MNLGTSWLSREILFGVLFAGFGFLFALMQWRRWGSAGLRNVLALVAAVFGLGLVISMAMVYYSLPSVPAWNHWVTLASFFATTVLLGAVAISAAFVGAFAYLHKAQARGVGETAPHPHHTLRWMALVSLVVLGFQLVIQPLYMGYLASAGPVAEKSAAILVDEYGMLFALRYVLLFLGAGLFSFFIYKFARSARNIGLLSTLAFSAFAWYWQVS